MIRPPRAHFQITSARFALAVLHLTLVLTLVAQTPPSVTTVPQSGASEFGLQLLRTPAGEREKLLETNSAVLNSELASFLLTEGDKRRGRVPWPEVIDIYRLGLKLAQKIGDKYWMARFHNSIAGGLRQTNDGAGALAEYEKGFQIAEQHGDKALMARLAYNLSDFPKYGDSYLDKALVFAKESGNKEMIALTSGKIGNRHTMRGELADAKEILQTALQIRRELGNPEGISIALSNLAMVQTMLGEYEEARENLLQSLAINRSVVDLYNLGNLYFLIGDYSSALAAYHESRELAKKENPNDEAAPVLINIANLYRSQGNLAQAEAMYHETLAAFERAKSNYGIPRSLGGLRDVYTDKGDLKSAIAFGERAHAIYVAERDGEVTRSFWKLGLLYAASGDDRKAEEYLRAAITSAEQKRAGIFATRLAMAKFEFGRRNWEAASKAAHNAVLSIAGDEAMTPDAWQVYDLLGQINTAQGRSDQARRDFEKAVALIERQRTLVAGGEDEASSFLRGKLSPYRSLVSLFANSGDTNSVFLLAERLKARALIDAVVGRRPLTDGMSNSEKETHRRLAGDMVSLNARLSRAESDDARAALQKELEAARLRYEDYVNRLVASKPELAVRRGELRPVEVSEVTKYIPRESVAVSFIVDRENVYAIRIGGKGPADIRVYRVAVLERDLEQKVESLRVMLARGDLNYQALSRDLYGLLLKPLAADLALKKNVIIVPDGVLWNLPFHALLSGTGKYLVETHAVTYAPSLTALREMVRKRNPAERQVAGELLAFGNPTVGAGTKQRVERTFMSEDLDPLPEAERLVNELVRLYTPAKSKVLTGAAAMEHVAKNEAPNYRIIQFATHGILNDASPMYSHLVFSRDEKDPSEDGLLEAWELKDLDLNADMVILSACDTARGKISGGEGVIGMTWAAFIAGAPATIASQWKVESSSTTEFMLEFHRQMLADKKISKAEALRRASLKLLKSAKYRHPSYWAPWVLVGDGS